MAGWDDQMFGNLPGSPKRPKPPPVRPNELMPVDPRQVIGGLYDQGAQGVGHAIDYATGQPVGEGFSQPTLGREAYQMLTSPTFGGGASPMAGAATLAAAPLAARAMKGARTAEEVAAGAKALDADRAATQAARAAVSSPGQSALDQMVQGGQAAAPPIIAYHGSPYAFDKFDTAHLGKGEGAAAYGQGFYFAQNEDVAKAYRNQLSQGRPYTDAQGNPLPPQTQADLLNVGALYELNRNYKEGIPDAASMLRLGGQTEVADRLAALDPSNVKRGFMYQVGINADPSKFLDWDKSFSEHDPVTQDLISRSMFENDIKGPRGKPADDWLQQDDPSGQDIFYRLGSNTVKGAEPRLQAAGVPGIQYLDQGSRGAGDGTRNYVVFNPSTIDILKRYGLAGGVAPVGAGAAAWQAFGQQGPGTTLNTTSQPDQQTVFY